MSLEDFKKELENRKIDNEITKEEVKELNEKKEIKDKGVRIIRKKDDIIKNALIFFLLAVSVSLIIFTYLVYIGEVSLSEITCPSLDIPECPSIDIPACPACPSLTCPNVTTSCPAFPSTINVDCNNI